MFLVGCCLTYDKIRLPYSQFQVMLCVPLTASAVCIAYKCHLDPTYVCTHYKLQSECMHGRDLCSQIRPACRLMHSLDEDDV